MKSIALNNNIYWDATGIYDSTSHKTQRELNKQLADAQADITTLRAAVGSPLVADTVSGMTDTDKIYVYTGSESGYTNGNWYYHNGTNWVSGGVYNATALSTDKTLTLENRAADSKKVGDEISDLKSAIDEITDDVIIEGSKNHFNKDDIVSGFYLNQTNGVVTASASHGYQADYIPINGDFVISNSGTSPIANYGLRVIYYNSNKEYLSGLSGISGSAYDSSLQRCYLVLTPPENAAFVRMSSSAWGSNYTELNVMVEDGNVPTEYTPYVAETTEKVIVDDALPDNTKIASNNAYQTQAHNASIAMPTVSANSLTNGQYIELPRITFHTQKTYSFYALITSFSGVRVGNEEAYDGTWVEVDATQIRVMRKLSDVAASYTFDHGLTIKTYIGVVISVNESGRATITIITDGGTFSKDNLGYEGRNGKIQAVSVGSTFGFSILSYSCNGYRSKVWAIGDSYLSNANNARWGYYLVNWGFTGYAFIGFPGEASAAGYTDFLTCLENGCPTYAIWAHGMNDPDTSSAINSGWLSCANDFLQTCEEYGIEPIFCTIPNTPTHLNTFKNAWIKSSGYRYIDFAKAVGAEEAASTWYDGMLSVDGTHPDVQGAIALASAAITECPELQLSL